MKCKLTLCSIALNIFLLLTGYSTTNWLPYSWSINNVAFAEIMHTALAYREAGHNEEAFRLLKSSVIDDLQNVLSEIRKGLSTKPVLPGRNNEQSTRIQAISGTSPQIRTVSGNLSGCRTLFIKRAQGKAVWLQPVQIEIERPSPSVYIPFGRLDKSTCEPVHIGNYFNDSITSISQNRYFSPRPLFTTLQILTRGIGEWCHPQPTAGIDDSRLRNYADNGIFTASNGIPLRTSGESGNIVFISLWNNFPDSVRILLSGNTSNACLLLAGTTAHMQSHVVNGVIIIGHKDGSADTPHLINPENGCPIEQDFFVDGQAFRPKTSPPYRLYLKSGLLSNHPKDLDIKGVYGRSIDGGAGILPDIPLNKDKQRKYMRLETISNDIVIGLMAITLQRYRPLTAEYT
ncbi:MAG: hypothetical protein LBG28_11765 [Tannerella sp.]|jgi:hypothetical protein|nr:hypothetical protein [Tannerella sp.]